MEVQRKKALEAINNHECGFYYEQNAKEYSKIPGSPVAYWVREQIIKDFEAGERLGNISKPRQGMATTNNNRFYAYGMK